jgi:hypothetical protein
MDSSHFPQHPNQANLSSSDCLPSSLAGRPASNRLDGARRERNLGGARGKAGTGGGSSDGLRGDNDGGGENGGDDGGDSAANARAGGDGAGGDGFGDQGSAGGGLGDCARGVNGGELDGVPVAVGVPAGPATVATISDGSRAHYSAVGRGQ